jgi:hypothetical protein
MSLPPDAPEKRVHWATFTYYYIAAFTGLIIMITGALMVVGAIVGESGDLALAGFLVALVGIPVYGWHLGEARKREGL